MLREEVNHFEAKNRLEHGFQFAGIGEAKACVSFADTLAWQVMPFSLTQATSLEDITLKDPHWCACLITIQLFKSLSNCRHNIRGDDAHSSSSREVWPGAKISCSSTRYETRAGAVLGNPHPAALADTLV
jgi:hypothetical protein